MHSETRIRRSTLCPPFEETLRYVARLTHSVSVTVIDVDEEQRVIAASGPALDDLSISIAPQLFDQHRTQWIDDASRGHSDLRSTQPYAVAVLPLLAGSSHYAVVLVREERGVWTESMREQVERFLPVITSLLAAIGRNSESAQVLSQQALLNSITDLAWMKDVRSRFVAVNHALAAALGRGAEEIIGTNDCDYFPADVADAYIAADRDVVTSGKTRHDVESLVDGAGRVRWIETVKNPVRDDTGAVVGTAGVARDITDRYELEETRRRLASALADEHQRLSDMVANVPGVVWEELFDLTSRYVSDYIETFLGYSAAEYLTRFASFMEVVHPDDRELVERGRREMIRQRRGVTLVFRAIRSDGRVVWCESHCRAIVDAEGNVIGQRGVSMDISDRKEAEDQLRASEEHFRHLANVTPVMIWTTNAEGRVTFHNERLREFGGFDDGRLVGDAWRDRLHPDDRARVLHALEEASERKSWMSLETRYLRHDGEYRSLLVEAAPRYAPDGTFIGFVGSCVDITDRSRLERRLDDERQLASLGRLAATIAHEINNVLMAIQPFADVVRRTSSPDVLQRAADHITTSVQRGRRITHEILRFANTSDPVLQPLDVETWLQNLSEELRATIGPRIDLFIDVRDRPCMLADSHQMTQVLTNLASNARDAMPSGGELSISARLEREWPGLASEAGPFVHLIVSDTGTGIPPEIADRLFEPLFTTKTTGTGLGLAIVRDVVRRHDGDVMVESPAGGGAMFHLIIPATSEQPVRASDDSATMPESVRRVLLVEDDETVASGVAAMLELEATQVAVASTGATALGAIAAFQPDLVVLDIGLPDVPGTVVFEQIRDRYPDLPVLFSTGHADELHGQIDQMRGPTAHLLKPYDLETLLATIRELVTPDDAS
ncbi:MAG TPA: PAS domain S-box protein [Thermoanaerobaculia bacterium]|nr:PAS domain S-box protein [Thermoanaerobaculia bacterium]